MTTIVGIFDNERYLDKSVGKLAHAGFEYTVYHEAIVAGEPGNFGGVGPSHRAMVRRWPGVAPSPPCQPSRAGTVSSGPLKPILHVAPHFAQERDRGVCHDVLSKSASSFWSERTPRKPSKSWRSCGSAIPGRRIAMTTQLRKRSTQTSSSTSCSRTRRTRFTLRTGAEDFFARVVRLLNSWAPRVPRIS